MFYNNCTLFGATLFYVTIKEFSTPLTYRPSRKTLEGKNLYMRKFVKRPREMFPNHFCMRTPFWLLNIIVGTHILARVNPLAPEFLFFNFSTPRI